MATTTTQLEEKIIEALDSNQVCSFATIEGNKPHVRYMALFHEGMTIYLATNKQTHKIEELERNPNVHLLLGYEGSWSANFLQIEGIGRVSKDEALGKKVWKDDFKMWFDGSDDPNYVILEITPQWIEYTGKGAKPEVWKKS
ncbi:MULTISPECIES: pyridoxamine 5'-phosphate oxidase family protein [unclassified Paenibacillus]|uniref:pyridoxamine 5'-phosphate oxidase family protein n=1 Tax=unclassified Paenibacillus TaxID=185978 RepID=UPI0036458F1D